MPETRFLTLLLPDKTQTRIAYHVWGSGDKIVLCVHGLTRNGRDFDFLAQALMERGYRVLAPDLPGRGESPALADPAHYSYALYLEALNALLAQENIGRCDYIGTSLGGILGMMLASAIPERIASLVLNDIGSVIAHEGLQRIGAYAAQLPVFASEEEALAYVARTFLVPFGIKEEAHIVHFLEVSLQKTPHGLAFRYDPAILAPLRAALEAPEGVQDVDLSAFWEKIACRVLLLRGMHSDILRHETALTMTQKPDVTLIEWPGCGHAPALYSHGQVECIAHWLKTDL